MQVSAVLFDLDGTLVDSIDDFVAVLNSMCNERGLAPMTRAELRDIVTQGTDAMLRRAGLSDGQTDPGHDASRETFLSRYLENVAVHTRIYPAMVPVLESLDRANVPWGIVTNKQARFTGRLAAALGLDHRAKCIVSGDTTPAPKPHPGGLVLAAKMLEIPASECLYVGDARTDVEAAHAAGMQSAVALFGYLPNDDPPATWGSPHLLHDPSDLASLLRLD